MLESIVGNISSMHNSLWGHWNFFLLARTIRGRAISRGHCGATADEGLLCSTWKGNCSMFNVHVRNTLFNFFQLQYTGTADDLKRRAIVEATADEDPGKRSVPGTGSVSTCTFAFFMHICFFYFKSSTRTFLHTKAQQLISPANRLLIKHILQFSL